MQLCWWNSSCANEIAVMVLFLQLWIQRTIWNCSQKPKKNYGRHPYHPSLLKNLTYYRSALFSFAFFPRRFLHDLRYNLRGFEVRQIVPQIVQSCYTYWDPLCTALRGSHYLEGSIKWKGIILRNQCYRQNQCTAKTRSRYLEGPNISKVPITVAWLYVPVFFLWQNKPIGPTAWKSVQGCLLYHL